MRSQHPAAAGCGSSLCCPKPFRSEIFPPDTLTSGVASIFHVDQSKFPWRQRRNAKHVILGTSSFFLQPKLGQAGRQGEGMSGVPLAFPLLGPGHPPLLLLWRKAAEPEELRTGAVLGFAAGPVAMTPLWDQWRHLHQRPMRRSKAMHPKMQAGAQQLLISLGQRGNMTQWGHLGTPPANTLFYCPRLVQLGT